MAPGACMRSCAPGRVQALKMELLPGPAHIQRVVRPKLDELPCPLEQPQVWEQWWRDWPGQWSALFKVYLSKAEIVAPMAAVPRMPAGPMEPPADEEEEDELPGHRCPDCEVFSTNQGMLSHARRVHGHRGLPLQ
mmetsp:Transcript_89765/g.279080  ORF Transcript_89765/g.279080 Transcript_89765/m.279080 type:complete len:135 (+) Transcript_89765:368-772(+)